MTSADKRTEARRFLVRGHVQAVGFRWFLDREVPDFPKKGILFYDITTLLKDKAGLATLIDALAEHYLKQNVDLVLGMEARGFIFAPALAYRLNAGFVPLRKPGKLPAVTVKF